MTKFIFDARIVCYVTRFSIVGRIEIREEIEKERCEGIEEERKEEKEESKERENRSLLIRISE